MTIHTLPAADHSFVLACDPDTNGYSSVYRLCGWQTTDGETYLPVGVCVATINEQEACRADQPALVDWEIGLFNRGAEVLRPDDARTFYHVHGADDRHAWEAIDGYRLAHYDYSEPQQTVQGISHAAKQH